MNGSLDHVIDRRQRDFILYWAMGNEPNEAMSLAGYDPSDQALLLSLIKNPTMIAYKKSLHREMKKQARIGTDYVIKYILNVLEFDYTQILGKGTLQISAKAVHALPDELKILISSIEPTMHGMKVKFVSKEKALALLTQITLATETINQEDREEEMFSKMEIEIVRPQIGPGNDSDSEK